MSTTTDPTGRSTPWKTSLLLACYVVVTCILLFHPLSFAPASHLPDEGDALQATWMMGWIAHQLPRDPARLFDANVYFPHPRGLAFSEHFLPHGILVGLMMTLGANLVLAYNLLALLTLVAIAVGTWLLARELGLGTAGSVAAGIAASLVTFNLEEVARLHILFMPALPLALLFLIRYFRSPSRLKAFGFASAVVVQGFASHYYLISLPLFLGPFGLFLLARYPERRNTRDLVRLAVPLATASLLFVPVELVYLDTFRTYRFHQPLPAGVDLARYLLPPFNSLGYGWLGVSGSELHGSNEHFLGLVPLGLAAAGIFRLARRRRRDENQGVLAALGVLGLVFALLSAGATTFIGGHDFGPGLYRLLYDHVPFFGYARVPERMSVYFRLVFALVVGVGATSIASRLRGARLAVACALFLVVVPLEHARVPARPYPRIPLPDELPDAYRWLARLPGDFAVAEFPVYGRRELRFYGYEDYFSTFHWKRVFFGRPSFYPPALEYLLWTFRSFPAPETIRVLQALDVRTVIYHPLRDPEGSDQLLRRLRRTRGLDELRRFGPASAAAEALGYGNEVVFALVPEKMPPPADPRNETPIPREGFRFETSSESDPLEAIDGDALTAWSSMAPQQKGQYFDVDLGGEFWVSRISLAFVYPYSEFPRELAVNGYHRSHRWERLELEDDEWASARLIDHLITDPNTATMDLVLKRPRKLERVRLFIQRTVLGDAMPEWKIPEIGIDQSPPGG